LERLKERIQQKAEKDLSHQKDIVERLVKKW
jgi:hypothetical protein